MSMTSIISPAYVVLLESSKFPIPDFTPFLKTRAMEVLNFWLVQKIFFNVRSSLFYQDEFYFYSLVVTPTQPVYHNSIKLVDQLFRGNVVACISS